VQLASGAQGDVARKLVERRADLGLFFHHESIPASLERRALGSVEMVTVCASATRWRAGSLASSWRVIASC
jgi:DNA-binding transcriptional LysR family regulator